MTTHADTRTVRCIRAIQLDNLGGQRGPELVDRRQKATMPSGPLGARMQRAPNGDAVSGARRRRPWWAEPPAPASCARQAERAVGGWPLLAPFASGGLDIRSRALAQHAAACDLPRQYILGFDPSNWTYAGSCDGQHGYFVARCLETRPLVPGSWPPEQQPEQPQQEPPPPPQQQRQEQPPPSQQALPQRPSVASRAASGARASTAAAGCARMHSAHHD